MPGQIFNAVIDDDESFRTALSESLLSLGHHASGFASAEEFIAGHGAQAWDIVITDIQMPGMSGFELKHLLASRGDRTPVIMITARAEAELATKALACGAVCLLRKPFEAATLLDWIQTARRS